jgi:hypothetical protein
MRSGLSTQLFIFAFLIHDIYRGHVKKIAIVLDAIGDKKNTQPQKKIILGAYLRKELT